jgi:hypothetical protein
MEHKGQLRCDPSLSRRLFHLVAHPGRASSLAVGEVQIILATFAPRYGYDPSNSSVYRNGYRHPVLSFSTAEHLLMLEKRKGVVARRG